MRKLQGLCKYLIVILLLWSCSPQKRLNRLLDNHPELKIADTVTIRDTVIIPEVKADTVLKIEEMTDTVYLEKENLKIKTVFRDNKVYIEGKCESDTVIVEKKVPIEKIVYVQDSLWTDVKKKAKRYWWFLLVATGIFVAYRLAKKFI